MQTDVKRAMPTEQELEQVWQAYNGEMQYSKYMLYTMAMEQGIDLDGLRDTLAMEWLLRNRPQGAAAAEKGEA